MIHYDTASLYRIGLLSALITVHGIASPARAQAPGAPSQATSAPRTQPFTLSVTSKLGFIDIALKAEGAKLSDVATELSKRLPARVVVGPSIRQQTISVNLQQSALEPALASLAPRVFVDYEIRQDSGAAPREIYLLGPNDTAPPMNTNAPVASQGLLIEGHTEEAPATPGEDPLKVAGDKQGLMITSKKQPLSLVAMALSNALGVPLDLKYEAGELVDVDIKYYAPPEDLIPRLSPNIRLHVRVDVINQQRTPLRLVVERPAAK